MKDALTPANLVTVVRMSRTHGRAYLIVEGMTDKRVFEQFVDDSRCFVRVAGDKSKVLEVLAELDSGLSKPDDCHGAIGIVDADFDRVNGLKPTSPNVISTDLHDLDCIICCSPAFEKVLREFCSEEKVMSFRQQNGDDIPRYLVSQALAIGCLRWISGRENLALRFGEPPTPEGTTRQRARELAFGDFVDRETVKVSVDKLVKTVLDHSQNHTLDRKILMEKVSMLVGSGYDPWQVACGHDVVRLFGIALQKALGSRSQQDVAADVLHRSLRLAFEFTHFKATAMFLQIQAWEQRHAKYRVLEN